MLLLFLLWLVVCSCLEVFKFKFQIYCLNKMIQILHNFYCTRLVSCRQLEISLTSPIYANLDFCMLVRCDISSALYRILQEIVLFSLSLFTTGHSFLLNCVRFSSVGRALDCRAGGCGFDSRGQTNTQGLKITEK